MVLPRMSKRDIAKLTATQKAIVVWRYYVTTNALD